MNELLWTGSASYLSPAVSNHLAIWQVTTLRQELEDFLKDDDDMAKMCLSRKRDQAAQWASAGNVQGTSPSTC